MTRRRDTVPREMPAKMYWHARRMNSFASALPHLQVVPVRVGDATGQALALANVDPPEWRGAAGWLACSPVEAEFVARQCRAASKRDRSNPWPSGYRTALRRLADQIDQRIQESRK